MIEHVGHEYYEDFFRTCESVLADNGLLVLQVILIWEIEILEAACFCVVILCVILYNSIMSDEVRNDSPSL